MRVTEWHGDEKQTIQTSEPQKILNKSKIAFITYIVKGGPH